MYDSEETLGVQGVTQLTIDESEVSGTLSWPGLPLGQAPTVCPTSPHLFEVDVLLH